MVDRAVAHRYAEAFVNALDDSEITSGAASSSGSQNSKRLETGLKELKRIAQTYVDSQDLQRFLGSPEIAQEDKERLLGRLWSDAVAPEVMALLKLLLGWDRVDHLPVISEEAISVAEQRQGLLRGQVITARPISSAETEVLAEAVGQLVGKKVVLERAVDPKILGGVRVSVGTTLLDSSVQTLLEDVRSQLKAVKVS